MDSRGANFKKGKFFEQKAIDFLKSKKYKIICQNFRSPLGEIDIIAVKDNCLIAVEVKGGKYPFEKINPLKIKKIYNTLQYFVSEQNLNLPNKSLLNKISLFRIDAIFITYHDDKIDILHIENITA